MGMSIVRRLASVSLLLAGVSMSLAKPLPQRGYNGADPSRGMQRLAFGSCLDFIRDRNQSFWGDIAAAKPDLFVGLGDWVYTDDKVIWKWRINADAARVTGDLAVQKAIPSYASFAAQVPITGVIDDHDAGQNDVNKLFSRDVVAAAQKALFEFLDEPKDSERFLRWKEDASGGQYQSFHLGKAPRRVHLILLDVRTFLDPWPEDRTSKDPSDPAYDPQGHKQDILGAQQWEWLEEEIRSSEAEVMILGSGLQFISRNDPALAEVWSKHPQSQAKLLSLLAKHGRGGALIISGDVHVAEVNRMSCAALGYPLYDFTSSGLTHSWGAPIQKQAWYGLMVGHTRVTEPSPAGDAELLYQGKNWGMLHFDWAEKEVPCADQEQKKGKKQCLVNDPSRTYITFEARGTETGAPLKVTKTVRLSTIQPPSGAGKARIERALLLKQKATEKARANYSVVLGPESESEFDSAILNYSSKNAVTERDEKEGGSLLPDSTGYPYLVSGAAMDAAALDMDLLEAIDACAGARLDEGHSLACMRVMHTCSPKVRIEHGIYYLLGHAAVLVGAWTPVIAGVGTGLWLVARKGGVLWSSVGVALIAGVLGLLRKLL